MPLISGREASEGSVTLGSPEGSATPLVARLARRDLSQFSIFRDLTTFHRVVFS